MLKFATLGSTAVIMTATMLVFVRKKFDMPAPTAVIEFAALCIMMNLFSPIAWVHHFVFLYPAVAVAWWGYQNRQLFTSRNIFRYSFFIWSVIILLPYIFSKVLGSLFRAGSNYTLAGLLLLLLLLTMVSRYRADTNSSAVKG
jgi:hypothetical protein